MREIKFRAWVNDSRRSTKQEEFDTWLKENAGKRVYVDSFIKDKGYNPYADEFMIPAPFMDYNVTVQNGKYGYGEGMEIYGTKDYPLMQYTGLKDKNGKEIYSGDIVRDERGKVGVLDDVKIGTWFMWLHEYQDFRNGMEIVIAESTGDMQTASFLEGTEVIGNIYEHPELLK